MWVQRIFHVANAVLVCAAIGFAWGQHQSWSATGGSLFGWVMVTAAVVFALLAALVWAIRDYRAWIALGEGGLPSNIFGWFAVTAMRPMAGDPFDQSVFADKLGSSTDQTFLGDLPTRAGPRPTVAPHAVPHRQTDQIPDQGVMQQLSNMFDGIVARNDDRLHYQLSQYEKHNQAIWLRDVEGGNPATGLGGEIGHFHPSDGSMHTILSPSDAKQVLDKGWGELHSMARFKRIFPTETFVMLYAPARAEHVPVIRDIIEAATRYALPRGNNSIKG